MAMGFQNTLSPPDELALPDAAVLTDKERAKLEKKLMKVSQQLEKVMTTVSNLSGDSTQRRWKAERAWDELAKEKMRIQSLLGI
jgi:hypothetical protein